MGWSDGQLADEVMSCLQGVKQSWEAVRGGLMNDLAGEKTEEESDEKGKGRQ